MAHKQDTLHQQYHKPSNRYNVLFLPGLPGEYRERPLITDLQSLDSNIFSVVYPGTYGHDGTLTPASTIESIRAAAVSLLESGLPLFVVSYSYSTLFVSEALSDLTGIQGVLLFSPIFDLNHSVTENFTDTCNWLNETQNCNVDIDSFKPYVMLETNLQDACNRSVASLRQLRTPLIYAVGDKDAVLQQSKVIDALEAYRHEQTPNAFFLCCITDGEHRLDSLYGPIIRRLVMGIWFAAEAAQIVPEASVYAWGATLNYRYSRAGTDIDLAIIGNEFTYDTYTRLNNLVNSFGSKHGVVVDIIVNTFDEVLTKERIRSNRGPSFLNELSYYYTPVRYGADFAMAQIDDADIIEDARFANETNIYKSKKALLNYPPGSSSSNWIMKDFLFGCYYHQYASGNLHVDQNNIESCYMNSNPHIYSLLTQIRKLKGDEYKGVTLEFLKEVLEAHESLDI